jgi:putative hydrolase of the HAD superfamily
MRRAVLLDLDETLIVEEPAAAAAFEATAAFAVAEIGEGLDTSSFVAAARAKARELWRASSSSDYCTAVGISSTEGLWCRFDGNDAPARALREWAPIYRRTVWSTALHAHGMTDDGLVEMLAGAVRDRAPGASPCLSRRGARTHGSAGGLRARSRHERRLVPSA